jgi:hypothetical protein
MTQDQITQEIIETVNQVTKWHRDKYFKDSDGHDFYLGIRRLCRIFHCNKVSKLDSYWTGVDNLITADWVKVPFVFRYVYDYIGMQSEDDVFFEYMDDCIYKIHKEFPEIFPNEKWDGRSSYLASQCALANKRVRIEDFPEIYITDHAKKSDFHFVIRYKFKHNKHRITCLSEITFYYPMYTQVTKEITMNLFCVLETPNGSSYTTEERTNDEWLLRKTAFVKFLDIMNLMILPSKVSSLVGNMGYQSYQYLKSHWWDILHDTERNTIRLG